MAKVLIVDDDKAICKMLANMAERMQHDATCTYTLKDGLKKAVSGEFDAVFLDVRLPDGNGLDVLPEIRKTQPPPEVIIITGAGDPDGAEIAVKNGAWDYVQKPLSPKKMILPLSRVLQYRDDIKKTRKPAVALKLGGIVGTSTHMRACLDSLAHAANSEVNVLITGETGTGKELFAKAIHTNNPRADKSFVVVDCAALPETLVESSLFGFEKGAFTGAVRSQDGLIKQAHNGTLFLDEVGELTLPLQKAFLRVLQERRFRPIGGMQEIESDFRLLAATNRDLDQMTGSGRFRKDLLYRLRSITIGLPPLRQHTEDIKELVLYYMIKICERYQTETKGFSPDFFDALYAYTWPGNVRELINTLEGVIIATRHEPTLFSRHLPAHIRIQVARASVNKSRKTPINKSPEESAAPAGTLPAYRDFREAVLDEAEKKYFQDLMSAAKGSIKGACQISGLGRTRLYTLMKKYGITRFGWAFPDIY